MSAAVRWITAKFAALRAWADDVDAVISRDTELDP